jgi:single-strand DNA-binding protein
MDNNHVTLAGNAARDPRIVPFKDGSGRLAQLTLAVDRSDAPGADFITCVCFGQHVTTVEDHVAKGTAIRIEGQIRTRSYQHNNTTRYTTEVVIDTIEIVARPRRADPSDTEPKADAEPEVEADLPSALANTLLAAQTTTVPAKRSRSRA